MKQSKPVRMGRWWRGSLLTTSFYTLKPADDIVLSWRSVVTFTERRNLIAMPRAASNAYRIQSPSFLEIQRALERAAINLVEPTEDIGRKLSTGALLQCAVL
jgi:hypothetical protein